MVSRIERALNRWAFKRHVIGLGHVVDSESSYCRPLYGYTHPGRFARWVRNRWCARQPGGC